MRWHCNWVKHLKHMSVVASLGQPAAASEISFGPTNNRYGNVGYVVKGGHATDPSFEVTTNDLIHDTQIIECTVASVLSGQRVVQISREFDHSLSCYIVWLITHSLIEESYVASRRNRGPVAFRPRPWAGLALPVLLSKRS